MCLRPSGKVRHNVFQFCPKHSTNRLERASKISNSSPQIKRPDCHVTAVLLPIVICRHTLIVPIKLGWARIIVPVRKAFVTIAEIFVRSEEEVK